MFKKAQQVVKVISGAGTETASIRTVVKVDKKKGFAYLDLDDICDDGQNTYRLSDGQANKCWIPGFSHRIIALEA
jgi:hypothetical protein